MLYLIYLWDKYIYGLPESVTYTDWCYNNGYKKDTSDSTDKPLP